ncbi:MAG: M43 family zinc metalloprotease, partial [Bacteroidota bacterium]
GTVEYNRDLLKRDGLTEAEFEQWIASLSAARQSGVQAGEYTIRVVVHIIHNGEPVGTGTNISDAQVISQLRVLNEDFQRKNTDASKTLTIFKSVATAMPVKFVLASTDPDGNPSTGIVRVKGIKSGYTRDENAQAKALSYWPAENYVNIWVCNLTDYFGFTQFPVTTVPGIGLASYNRFTDGIIINYRGVGSIADGPFTLDGRYNRGRVLSHEMGHFFGLRHIWGDGTDCTAPDYVEDTPSQSAPTEYCPQGLLPDCSNQPRMYQNFMDYTYDLCMNLFTQGQVDRMLTVLENSPRRKSLLVASGDIDPVQFPALFSPNNDGVNDYWFWANTLDYSNCRLLIYDRFGAVVYDKKGYDNTWNGRGMDGRQLEEEAYYYELRCDGTKTITGGVRIIR